MGNEYGPQTLPGWTMRSIRQERVALHRSRHFARPAARDCRAHPANPSNGRHGANHCEFVASDTDELQMSLSLGQSGRVDDRPDDKTSPLRAAPGRSDAAATSSRTV